MVQTTGGAKLRQTAWTYGLGDKLGVRPRISSPGSLSIGKPLGRVNTEKGGDLDRGERRRERRSPEDVLL